MWIFLSLTSRFLWSGCNVLDQFLSRAHEKDGGVLCLVVLQMCCIWPFAIMAYFMSDNINFSYQIVCWSGFGLAMSFLASIPYFVCLQKEEAYNVVPFFEFTPIFLALFAAIIYSEYPNLLQVIGGLVVISCGFIFSWDFENGIFKKKAIILMGLSSFLYAVYQLSIRAASDFGDAWAVVFCFSLVEFICGIFMFFTLKNVRSSIIKVFKKTSGKTFMFSTLATGLDFLALLTLTAAFKLAPSTGHVAALSGIQPFFLFFLAVLLGKTIPKHYEVIVFNRTVKLKLLLLLGIFFGVYLLLIGT